MPAVRPEPVPWRAALALGAAAGRAPLWQRAALAVGVALLPLLGLFAMRALVDAVADGLAARIPADVATRSALAATALAAAVALVGNLLRSCSEVLAEHHGRRLADAGTEQLQRHAARVALAQFDRPAFHDALQRAGAEAGQRPLRLVQDGTAFLVALLSLVTMSGLLLLVEPWLPALVAAAAVPIAWARRRHARERFAWHAEHVVPQREVGYLGAVLTGRATAKDVRVLDLEPTLGARLADLRARLRASLARLAVRRARDDLIVHTVAGAALFVAYAYLAQTALAGGLTLGGLVLQAQAAQRTQNAVRDLLAAGSALHEDRLFLRPLLDFLAVPAAPRAPTGGAAAPFGTGPVAIAASGLDFRYPDAPRLALAGVAFALAPGERLGVVGANGSGKSTLIKLLCGLYPRTAGQLLIDGAPLADAQPDRWRQRLAVLLQDAGAFELSLRENLQLGHPVPPADDTLWAALAVVGLDDRVRALPRGLDTPVGRRLQDGVDWSTGEARRLVLARALAQPADVLLLDEPFATLDGGTAAAVAAHLAGRPRNQTVVVVDHRPPLRQCIDRLLWLDAGRVVAFGARGEVIAAPGFAERFPEWAG